jgi:hypothetical protein
MLLGGRCEYFSQFKEIKSKDIGQEVAARPLGLPGRFTGPCGIA